MADGDLGREDGEAPSAAGQKQQRKARAVVGAAAEHAQKQDSPGMQQQQEDSQADDSRDQDLSTAPSDQAAAVLAMLASSVNGKPPADAAADGAEKRAARATPAKRASGSAAADDSGRPAKLARSSSNDSQQQQQQEEEEEQGQQDGTESAGDADQPDSPTGSDAVAAAASLHKLSSASAAELDGSLAAFRAAVAATERLNSAAGGGGNSDRGLVSAADSQLLLGGLRRIGSGMSNVPLGSGGPLKPGQSKQGPHDIMQGLVEAGLLQSYTPETHCYVKCGNVQGVFSLASGSILCLCNACSAHEPCWFAPAAFERHGGMAASKKWRGSIQVKGLSSRKTLGQWLDDRGVTAKPRLTLADQVQQHTVVAPGRSSRGGAAGGAAAAAAGLAATGGAVGSGDLSGAVGGVARIGSGLRRASAQDSWNRSTGGGAVPPLSRGISAGEGELLEALQHATGLPSVQRSVSNTAQLAQAKQQLAQQAAALADGSSQPRALHRGSLNSSQLDHLLDQVGILRGSSLAASSAAAGAEAASTQQQLAAAGIHPGALTSPSMPPPSQVPAAAGGGGSTRLRDASWMSAAMGAIASDGNQEAVNLLMQLVPSLPPEKAAAAAAAIATGQQLPSLRCSTAAGTPPEAVFRGPSSPPWAPLMLKREFGDNTGFARSRPSADGGVGATGDAQQAPKRSLKEVLLVATTTAAKNPSAASALLLEALQQQLELQPASCRQAAAGAAAAVASAGDMLQASMGMPRSKQPSAAAAFAAIAAAAAAAAATAAGLEEEQQRQQEEADAIAAAASAAAAQLSPSMRPPRASSGGAGGYPAATSGMGLAASALFDADALGLLNGSGAAQLQQALGQMQQQQQQQQQVSQLLASLLGAAQMKQGR